MIPFLRSQFNAAWTPFKHKIFLDTLGARFGEPSPFTLSETPVFLTSSLVAKAALAGQELVGQLLANPSYLAASDQAIPAAYKAPGDEPFPLFVQADFGLDAEQNLKLVEIQGFPSLYGFQVALSHAYRDAYLIHASLSGYPAGLSGMKYEALLRRAIVADHDPENVVLLEIDPAQQKTRHDFTATSQMLGIPVVDARTVVKQGSRLFYTRAGNLVPIERIYNRVIADELERRNIALPFRFSDELNVEWAGHPNWFYRLSKFSLPFFDHPASPRCYFLSEAPRDLDLRSYVLKPLYSFAGSGVVIGPTQAEVDSVPADQRAHYVLQERVDFTPWIRTPEGTTKLEIRVMYIWRDGLQPVNLIIRTGRGAQMGVDHNKNMGWIGASAAFVYSGNQA